MSSGKIASCIKGLPPLNRMRKVWSRSIHQTNAFCRMKITSLSQQTLERDKHYDMTNIISQAGKGQRAGQDTHKITHSG